MCMSDVCRVLLSSRPFFGWLSLQTASLPGRRTMTNFTAKPFVRYQSPSADCCLYARKVDVVSDDDDETDEAHPSLKRCDNNNYLMSSPLSLDVTSAGPPFVYTSTGKVITAEETSRAKEVISQRLTLIKVQPGAQQQQQQRRLSNPSPKSQPSPLVSPSSSHSSLLLTPALRDRAIVSLTCLPCCFAFRVFVHF